MHKLSKMTYKKGLNSSCLCEILTELNWLKYIKVENVARKQIVKLKNLAKKTLKMSDLKKSFLK